MKKPESCGRSGSWLGWNLKREDRKTVGGGTKKGLALRVEKKGKKGEGKYKGS